jgi:hypothetical protein
MRPVRYAGYSSRPVYQGLLPVTTKPSSLQELRSLLEDFSDDLLALQTLLPVDVPSSLNKIRYITEKVLHRLCSAGDVAWGAGEPTLERMIGPLVSRDLVPRNVAIHVRTIQTNTSPGSHFQEAQLTGTHVSIAVSALEEFLRWYHAKQKKKRRRSRDKEEHGSPPDSGELVNPYEFAGTASERTFKGRQEQLGELLDSIRTGTHTAIFGLQRMGKTSLIEEGLKEALERDARLQRELLLVRIDLQGLGGDQVKYRDLVHAIIEAITERLEALGVGRSIQDMRALTNEMFSSSRFQRGDRTQFFAMFAKLLRGFSAAAHRRIVLIIDEFSEVRKVIERNRAALQHNPIRTANLLPHEFYIDVPFIHHLGSLLKDRDLMTKLTLIILVRPFMSEYDDREELQILKLMKPIPLFYLEEPDARALITEPLAGHIAYEAGAADLLYRLTAGHPYLLQFILKLLVDRIKREGRRTVTLADIANVEKRLICEGCYDAQFEVLISDYSVAEITHPKEALLGKGTLALVAKIGDELTERWVPEGRIFESLFEHKVPIEKTASLLSQLTRTRILEEESQDGRLCYRIAILLLHKRFITQNMYLKYFH